MDLPAPALTPVSAPYWEALEAGVLSFQRCATCSTAWSPPRDDCPKCLSNSWSWDRASGEGRVISWVRFRHAFHPALVDRVPYVVAVIELDEGPRLVANIIGPEDELAIERRVTLVIQTEGTTAVPRFRLASEPV